MVVEAGPATLAFPPFGPAQQRNLCVPRRSVTFRTPRTNPQRPPGVTSCVHRRCSPSPPPRPAHCRLTSALAKDEAIAKVVAPQHRTPNFVASDAVPQAAVGAGINRCETGHDRGGNLPGAVVKVDRKSSAPYPAGNKSTYYTAITPRACQRAGRGQRRVGGRRSWIATRRATAM